MRLIPVGRQVRLSNAASVFHGRWGVLVTYVWPEMPNPAVSVRLLPDDGGPPLPCHLDELVEMPHSDNDAADTINTEEPR
jgi:hypothetical protein